MPGKYKSDELRKLIVEAKQRGELVKDIAERYHCGRNTVQRIWKLWNDTHSVKPKKKTGRPRKTTPGQARLLVRQVKKDPFMTAVDLAQYAQDNLGLNMTALTARRLLIAAGLRGRIPAKKPWISKENRMARLKFAQDHEDLDGDWSGLEFCGLMNQRTTYSAQMELGS